MCKRSTISIILQIFVVKFIHHGDVQLSVSVVFWHISLGKIKCIPLNYLEKFEQEVSCLISHFDYISTKVRFGELG